MRGYKSDVSFICPKCQVSVNDTVDVPEPHWVADRASDMTADDDIDLSCEECDGVFLAHVHVTGGQCDITLSEFPATEVEASDGCYDGPDEDDQWLDDLVADDPYNVFLSSQHECTQYLATHGGDGLGLLNRMIFAQHITALEAYLSDTLISQTEGRKDVLLALLENDKRLLERKFALKEFIHDPELIKRTVRKHLREVLYHDLPKVDFLYRHAFKIDLFILMGEESSGKLLQGIKYRHDCVHRNGKDQDDKKLDVFTKEYVAEIGKIVHDLVEAIEQKIFDTPEF